MDPNIQNILIGLLTNGLTSFIAQFGQKESKILLGKNLYEKTQLEETSLQPIIKKAVKVITESIEWQGIPTVEIACLFLCSPEAETIIRQIYATTLLLKRDRKNLITIQKEFFASFYLYTTSYTQYKDLKEVDLVDSSTSLINLMIEGCEQVLNSAINNGILSAHEAKATFRHQIILDEIASIKENLSFLNSLQKPNLKEILEFEKTYRRLISDQNKYITPPNFDKARMFHINNIYVLPNLLQNTEQKGKPQDTDILTIENKLDIPYKRFLSKTFRAVLLGNPGGGKSTFAKKLCYDLATHNSERSFAGRKELTPILVTLRDYGVEKKNHNLSILEFIKIKTKSDYQIEPPTGAFEYLLLNGRATVIFDGLDELLETNYRQEISRSVNSFCTLYPSVPILVTSREIGYEQAPLDKEKFEIFLLAAFDTDQVRDYAKKWFDTVEDLPIEQRKQKVDSFLSESDIIPDLRSNPLMLALLCNIYREENYIPKHKPDIYEKCATMLFERWDRSRGIEPLLPFESQIRPAMSYLAYWIYSNEELRGGVTEEKLIEKTKEYLCQKLYENPDEAAKAARDFIEFCRGRAWVFTSIGSTKDEEIYKFTHQTFLEYFAAIYLFRTHPTPISLLNTLHSRIAKREWDIVGQLAFQIQNKNIENAGNELLSNLTEKAYKAKGEERWNLLSFVVRCLEFIICSPKTLREITTTCVKLYIAEVKSYSITEATFTTLLTTAKENQRTIALSIEELIIEIIEGNNEAEAILALQIGLTFQSYLRPIRFTASGPYKTRSTYEDTTFWKSISLSILNKSSSQLIILSQKSPLLSSLALGENKISIVDMVKWHGFQSIFISYSYPLRHNLRRSAKIDVYIRTFLASGREKQHRDKQYVERLLQELTDLADYLILLSPPWIISSKDSQVSLSHAHIPHIEYLKNTIEFFELNNRAAFGLIMLLAILYENGSMQKLIENFSHSDTPISITHPLFAILSSRGKSSLRDDAKRLINNFGFTPEQKELIWRWLLEEISLIHPPISRNYRSNSDTLSEDQDF